MAVRVRLTRVGSKKNPIWRVVVADQRSPRDGRVIETIGRYNAQVDPSEVVLDRERLQYWLDRGAQPTNTVRKLMRVGAGSEPVSAPSPDAAPASADPAPAADDTASAPAEPAAASADTAAEPDPAAADTASAPAS